MKEATVFLIDIGVVVAAALVVVASQIEPEENPH